MTHGPVEPTPPKTCFRQLTLRWGRLTFRLKVRSPHLKVTPRALHKVRRDVTEVSSPFRESELELTLSRHPGCGAVCYQYSCYHHIFILYFVIYSHVYSDSLAKYTRIYVQEYILRSGIYIPDPRTSRIHPGYMRNACRAAPLNVMAENVALPTVYCEYILRCILGAFSGIYCIVRCI